MEIRIDAKGEIVERQELLNGTRTVAFEGATVDGVWVVSGVVSWNLGLVEFPGEGDLTLARDDGGELYATLTRAAPVTDDDGESDVSLDVEYEVDGGAAEFDARTGSIRGRVRVKGDEFESAWVVALLLDTT